MVNKMSIRDPHVELLRIIAAFIVIIVHTNLSAYINGDVDYSRVFLKCCAADGVAIFWLITGFFYFRKKNWLHLLRKTVKTIIIPTLVLLLFWQFLGTQFLIDHNSIWDSIKIGLDNIGDLKNVILEFDTKYIPHIGYLWYMMVYFLLMLLYPLFSGFEYLSNKEKNFFLIIVAGIFLLNDIHLNQLMRFSPHTINGLIPAVMICVIGERLYLKRDFFRGKMWTVVGGRIYIN